MIKNTEISMQFFLFSITHYLKTTSCAVSICMLITNAMSATNKYRKNELLNKGC